MSLAGKSTVSMAEVSKNTHYTLPGGDYPLLFSHFHHTSAYSEWPH